MKNRLWLALLLPALLIIGILTSIYVPRFLIHPNQDFLFAINPMSCNDGSYSVKKNQLAYETKKPEAYCKKTASPLLYFYSVKDHKASLVTYADAKKRALNFSTYSNQGLRVMTSQDAMENGHYLDFFFFMSYPNNQLYLTGHGYTDVITIPKSDFYGKTFFAGWVNP